LTQTPVKLNGLTGRAFYSDGLPEQKSHRFARKGHYMRLRDDHGRFVLIKESCLLIYGRPALPLRSTIVCQLRDVGTFYTHFAPPRIPLDLFGEEWQKFKPLFEGTHLAIKHNGEAYERSATIPSASMDLFSR
jgi:hypothetical protein